jgi:hypothetical protein
MSQKRVRLNRDQARQQEGFLFTIIMNEPQRSPGFLSRFNLAI